MSKYGEIRNDYYDENECKVYIDAWETYDDDEEGTVIATVNYKTKEVEYFDEDARTDKYVQEVIEETLKNIDDGDFEFRTICGATDCGGCFIKYAYDIEICKKQKKEEI